MSTLLQPSKPLHAIPFPSLPAFPQHRAGVRVETYTEAARLPMQRFIVAVTQRYRLHPHAPVAPAERLALRGRAYLVLREVADRLVGRKLTVTEVSLLASVGRHVYSALDRVAEAVDA